MTKTKTTEYIGNIIYENNALKRILVDGGYIEGGVYYYYLTDHLGNNRVVANQGGTMIQKTHYYPFGSNFATSPGAELQPYKYNGKELDQMHGLNLYDYSARLYDPVIPHFGTVDPLAEKYYSWSPYAYVMNNPLKYIDPDGKDIIISGAQNQQALKELQGAAGSSITLSFGDNGTVNYNLNTNEPLSGHAATIVNIINDNSVAINLATNEGPVSSLLPGALLGGGLFMGNTFSTDKNGNTIVSGTQEIDPSFLNALDSFWGTPGQTTMHELTEGYSAAKTTQVTGVTASPKLPEQPNDAYDKADNAAVPQNPISIVFLDKNGKPTSVQNAYTVAWFTNNGSDTKVLQTIFLEDEK